jgi:hypothetical protein
MAYFSIRVGHYQYYESEWKTISTTTVAAGDYLISISSREDRANSVLD